MPEETLRKLDFSSSTNTRRRMSSRVFTDERRRARRRGEILGNVGNENSAVAASAAIASTAGVAVIARSAPRARRRACRRDRLSQTGKLQKLLSTLSRRCFGFVGDERVVDTTGAGDAFVGAFCAPSRRSVASRCLGGPRSRHFGGTRVGAEPAFRESTRFARESRCRRRRRMGDDVDHETEASMLAAPPRRGPGEAFNDERRLKSA